jgi:hypothetical protein
MKRKYYYIIARGERYGEGFVHMDAEMQVEVIPAPHMFENKAAAELLAEHFMAEFGGRAVVKEVML